MMCIIFPCDWGVQRVMRPWGLNTDCDTASSGGDSVWVCQPLPHSHRLVQCIYYCTDSQPEAATTVDICWWTLQGKEVAPSYRLPPFQPQFLQHKVGIGNQIIGMKL